MARGKRAKLLSDKSKDFWAKRPKSFMSSRSNRPGTDRWTKKQTTQAERRQGKRDVKNSD